MLFMVTHTHSAEACPGGPFNPRPGWMNTVAKRTEESGVKVIADYAAVQAHLFWWIVETDSSEALTTFIWPLEEVGKVEALPIQTMAEVHEWGQKHNVLE